ncbi:Permease, cytosine/purine, uracil, thiamine, allantoin [Penicillium italicum]|uniref:Permease, cytosine/purine, uracil, thiamine, allantoin n=1 Tax=Penicillium italicum TaxID=40296 RepID=A0A0A2LK76_PENIT|nr:Permease, cytosine/purine, uracil, thiamine, allantoin [Penicillium italicum]
MLPNFTKTSRSSNEDLEKAPQVNNSSYLNNNELFDNSSDGAVPGESFEYGDSMYAKLQRVAGKFNIEQRGVERVPDSERTDTSYFNIGSMWLAANMVVSSFAIGVLGKSAFSLGFVDAILVCLFFNLLGVMTVCFFLCFGPPFGLRQMVLSRFWFGWWPVKFIAVLNVIACIGWSAANAIVGAQLLKAVNGNVPGFAGILIITFCTLFITFAGYKVVHAYEYWSWIPTTIVFIIVLGTFAHSGDFINIPMGVGISEMGSCLSFGSTVYGFATGWTSYAADYTVYQPKTQSSRLVFFAGWLGLIIPLIFTQFLGIAVMSATAMGDGVHNKYAEGYSDSGNGGLIAAVLEPLGGFGKFCLVILALSIIANNCPNIYSVGLTLQVLSRATQRVPRFIWTFVASCVSLAIAIPGYDHFETVLENFMNLIAYWLAIYSGIALVDHFVFRRGFGGYRPEDYDKPDKLPIGIAASVAFAVGVAGVVVGMSQTWWMGPVARHAGDPEFGGDVGFELGFAFASVAYCILRPIELRTGGLGAASAIHLAKHNPSHIYISGRNATNAEKVIKQIHEDNPKLAVTFIKCDLASLSSVKEAAERFTSQHPTLNILMCNAGIMAQPPSTTVDGYELQFGTNHLGHALLIKKLLPLLKASTDPRIVLLTSQGWGLHPCGGIIFKKLKTAQNISFGGPWVRYGQSKLANLIYARELAKRFPDITSVSVHPGIILTGLDNNLGIKEKMLVYALSWWRIMQPHEGAFSQTWAATVDKAEIWNGGYYEPVGKLANGKLDSTARDEALAERLWDWTEETLKGF